MTLHEVATTCGAVVEEVSKVVVGKEDVLRKVMLAILTNSHLLIEDVPGLAKTLMAKTFAAALNCKFARVQFTPDLLPSDITGTYVYNQKVGDFELRRGPIFTNILLADEINRSPPKTQAALLEAMQERQVTLDGSTHRLESPLVVLATQNPIEFEGVYQLPEAQLDRFLMKVRVGYPTKEQEKEILSRRIERKSDDFQVEPVADPAAVIKMQAAVEDVHIDDDVLGYIVDIVRSTRTQTQIEVGASPRGAMALMKVARANAAFEGRDYVVPDDVKDVAIPALTHRIVLKAESWMKGMDPTAILTAIVDRLPVPKVK